MRHPPSDKRAAQFMFASPRSAKHVRTSSCAKALARMSYTRGLASFFIVATPASNWEGPSLFLRDAVNDSFRRGSGRHQSVPGVGAKTRIELLDRRQIG